MVSWSEAVRMMVKRTESSAPMDGWKIVIRFSTRAVPTTGFMLYKGERTKPNPTYTFLNPTINRKQY